MEGAGTPVSDLATKIHSFGRIWCVQVAGPEQTWRGPIRPGGETGVSSIRSPPRGRDRVFLPLCYTTIHNTLCYSVTLPHWHIVLHCHIVTCTLCHVTIHILYCTPNTHVHMASNFLLRLHCGTLSHHLSPCYIVSHTTCVATQCTIVH